MPIAKVQLPNGKIAKFEVPEGTTQEQVMAFAESNLPALETPKTDLQGTAASRLLQGVGQGFSDFIGGALQTGAEIAGAEDFANLVAEAKQRTDKRGEQMGSAYKAGEVIGGIAPALLAPVGAGLGLAGRAVVGAASGAVTSAIAPRAETMTTEQALGQRSEQAQTGALVGAAVPVALSGLANILPSAKQVAQKIFDVSEGKLKVMTEAGLEPTLATIGGKTPKILQQAFSQTPFVGDVLTESAEKTLADVSSKLDKIAGGKLKAETALTAGEVVKSGLQRFGGNFKSKANELYSKVDKFVAPSDKIKINNITAFLQQLDNPNIAKPVREYRNKAFTDFIKTINSSVDDTNALNYETLKTLRTKIGEDIVSEGISPSGVSQGVLKQAYKAITGDMEALVQANGDDAVKAWNRANNFYKAGTQRMDNYLNDLVTKTEPQKIYNTLKTKTRDGVYQLRAVKKSLAPDEFDAFRGLFIKEMGLPQPDAAFSPYKFLRSWKGLDRDAKNVLFSGKFAERGRDLEKIAKAVDQIKGVEELANTSGTARVALTQLGGLAFTGSVLSGGGTAATPYIGALLLGRITARQMANPKFVKWLAKSVEIKSPKMATQHIAKLVGIAETNPEIANDISDYLESLND